MILIGFSIVGLPLIGALVYSAVRIDQLSEQSRHNVYQATQITNGTSVIIGEIMAMQRSVQHALVLDDASLLEGYFLAHTKFENITNHLPLFPFTRSNGCRWKNCVCSKPVF